MDDKVDILIVDDLSEKVLVYQTVLEELGENLVVAKSGQEALAQVLRREFAVILLDVYMPGMDGLETAALIRQRKKSAHTPIIFVTAFADEVRLAQGYAHGAVDYILAPIVPTVLRAKVKVFVDLFRMTRQVKRQAEERVVLAEERSRRAAAEEANRRLAFVARAGAVLGKSLDYEQTAADAVRLPVPELADVAVVVLADSDGAGSRTVVARSSADGLVVDNTLELPADLDAVVGRAFACGKAAFVPEPAAGADPISNIVALPLMAGGRTAAVLALARTDAGRPFSLADLAAADALASRAASALENARLYHETQLADRQKNEFLTMLAHELRNPLAPIRNAVTILRDTETDVTRNWAGGVIDRQVRHLVRLVDDLLDISRITRGKIRLRRETIDLATVVVQAVEASRPEIESRGHQLSVNVPPEPLWVNGDSARLAQVLTNLLNNAAKYTEPGGQINLSVDAVAGSATAGEAIVRIRDTGIGIPRTMLGTVFDLFMQGDNSLDRSQGGLGIGLTLVRRLVELHEGTVTAVSDGPGQGSEFTVRLPLVEQKMRVADCGCETPAAPIATANVDRVLVVDDNVDGAESLARLLRLNGHDVRVAHDGPSALTAAREFRPGAVVLDIGLPEMDGFEVARRLRARPDMKKAMLIAVTGYGRDEDRQRSRQAGFDHHLVKPVDLNVLRTLFTSEAQNVDDGTSALAAKPAEQLVSHS